MQNFSTLNHTRWDCKYHVVFIPKCRRKVLYGRVRQVWATSVDEQKMATFFWIGTLICGAIGGFAFPRVGHFLAYAFISFINVMLSLTIGKNIGEQAALFVAFTLTEVIFFMSRDVLRETKLLPAEAGRFESFVSYGLKSFAHD